MHFKSMRPNPGFWSHQTNGIVQATKSRPYILLCTVIGEIERKDLGIAAFLLNRPAQIAGHLFLVVRQMFQQGLLGCFFICAVSSIIST